VVRGRSGLANHVYRSVGRGVDTFCFAHAIASLSASLNAMSAIDPHNSLDAIGFAAIYAAWLVVLYAVIQAGWF
jgi:hypothetical protein